jgi:nicotinamide/nicotinate riboside kinase
LNKNVEVEIDPEALVKWTQRFQELEDELKAGGEEIVWFIVDGFVLYWDPVSGLTRSR